MTSKIKKERFHKMAKLQKTEKLHFDLMGMSSKRMRS